jgi:hypothetical protein
MSRSRPEETPMSTVDVKTGQSGHDPRRILVAPR